MDMGTSGFDFDFVIDRETPLVSPAVLDRRYICGKRYRGSAATCLFVAVLLVTGAVMVVVAVGRSMTAKL